VVENLLVDVLGRENASEILKHLFQVSLAEVIENVKTEVCRQILKLSLLPLLLLQVRLLKLMQMQAENLVVDEVLLFKFWELPESLLEKAFVAQDQDRSVVFEVVLRTWACDFPYHLRVLQVDARNQKQ